MEVEEWQDEAEDGQVLRLHDEADGSRTSARSTGPLRQRWVPPRVSAQTQLKQTQRCYGGATCMERERERLRVWRTKAN